jgi:hypothetical protein
MQNCRNSLQSRYFLRVLRNNASMDTTIRKKDREWIEKTLFYKRYSMTKNKVFKETGMILA